MSKQHAPAAVAAIAAAFVGIRLGWATFQVALAATAAASAVIDWGQTRHIAKNPGRFYEKNPVLGTHPSLRRVDVYFSCVTAAGIAIAVALPEWARTAFLLAISSLETTMAVLNMRLGIKTDFFTEER